MSDTVLYQSVLQKLGQLDPNSLVELDAFLSVLIKHDSLTSPKDKLAHKEKSAIDWLEELAQMGSFEHIEDPVEWQRTIREDRKLPFR